MAIRPVDLQQTILKASDISRETTIQQEAGASQQMSATGLSKEHDHRAETVQQFDEAAATLIREREERQGQQQQRQDEANGRQESAIADQNPRAMVPRPKLGRHIDLQA